MKESHDRHADFRNPTGHHSSVEPDRNQPLAGRVAMLSKPSVNACDCAAAALKSRQAVTTMTFDLIRAPPMGIICAGAPPREPPCEISGLKTVENEPERHREEDAHLLTADGGGGAVVAAATAGDDAAIGQLLDPAAEPAGLRDVEEEVRRRARGRIERRVQGTE